MHGGPPSEPEQHGACDHAPLLVAHATARTSAKVTSCCHSSSCSVRAANTAAFAATSAWSRPISRSSEQDSAKAWSADTCECTAQCTAPARTATSSGGTAQRPNQSRCKTNAARGDGAATTIDARRGTGGMGGGLRRRDTPGGDLGARSRSDDDHDVGQPLGEECHHPDALCPMHRDP